MNNAHPLHLPRYYNRTSLGSVFEAQCRAAINAFEGLQIRDGFALLATVKQPAIEPLTLLVSMCFDSPRPNRYKQTPTALLRNQHLLCP